MDTDIMRAGEVGGGVVLGTALAAGHLDISVILGTAIGVVVVALLRPIVARLTAIPEPAKPPKP